MRSRIFEKLLAVFLVSVLAVSCVTNPVTGKSQFSLVTEEQEIQLGAQAYGPMLQQSNGPVSDPELQDYIQNVGAGLARVSHRANLDYQFRVVNANYFNAFALPGGKICITRGLLAQMKSEDQAAGVIGHEVGHVTARHGAQSMTRAMGTQLLLGAGAMVMEAKEVGGRDLILAGAGMGAQLVLLRYSRDQERESDELGMQYMAKAGYNPRGFVESMEILKTAHEKEPSKLEALFQSHPVTGERIDTGRQRAAQLYASESARPAKTTAFNLKTKRLKDEIPAFKVADEGEKAMAQKDYRTAVSKFMEASRLAPRQAILPAYEALARLRMKDYSESKRAAREAIRRDAGLFHGHYAAGLSSFATQEWQESIGSLTEAEKLTGPDTATSYFIGRSYEALGDQQNAARRYQFVIQNGEDGEETRYAYRRLQEWGALPQQQQR